MIEFIRSSIQFLNAGRGQRFNRACYYRPWYHKIDSSPSCNSRCSTSPASPVFYSRTYHYIGSGGIAAPREFRLPEFMVPAEGGVSAGQAQSAAIGWRQPRWCRQRAIHSLFNFSWTPGAAPRNRRGPSPDPGCSERTLPSRSR